MLGSINDAADELKSAAQRLTELLPDVQFALASADRAMQRISLGVDVGVAWLILVALGASIILFIYFRVHRQTIERELNRHYLRAHYGDDVDTASKTYISLMKFHAHQCNLAGLRRGDVRCIRAFLIGADLNEEIESRIWDRQKYHEEIGRFLLVNRPFLFRSIADAMHVVDSYWIPLDKESNRETLFVFILISSRDPTIWGPQQHDAFAVPSSLRDQPYALVGTGTEKGRVAHRLDPSSTGPDGELLGKSLPLGPEKAGVTF